jgi:hypothetical protein
MCVAADRTRSTVATFAATFVSHRRGEWCSSPRLVVTTYAAINMPRGARAPA